MLQRSPAMMIDQNTNGMSDVWEVAYNATGLAPETDSDSDGISNVRESLVATDPLSAASLPRITTCGYTPSMFSVTFPSVAGVYYELQSTTALGSTNWLKETNLMADANSTITLNGKADAIIKYFRIAATNSGSVLSAPTITAYAHHQPSFSVTMPCARGKRYELQSLTTITSTNWLAETNTVVRDGMTVTLSGLAREKEKFFRMAVSDLDSDGDGVNDWEEYKLGLDPLNASSTTQLDGNGNLPGDYAYTTNQLALQNVFFLTATDPVATQPDPGSAATDSGQFTVTRGGFPLNAVTVNLGLSGPGTGFATAGIDHSNLPATVVFSAGTSSRTTSLTPLANTNRLAPVIAQWRLLPGTGYSVSSTSNASVVIYPSVTANGTGLFAQYFTNASTTYTNGLNFNTTNPANPLLTRIDPVIDFNWTNGTSPNLSNGLYCVRWTGQIQPQYSETYYFDVRSDDGVKLWIDDQLIVDKWQTQNNGLDWTNSLALQGGTRYNFKLEYLQNGGKGEAHLYWFSPNQSKQIVPANRLYPTNSFSGGSGSNAPAAITSALTAVGFVGQSFSFTVTAANSPLRFAATNLPPGLALNVTNGLISGTPILAGDFQVSLTASNAVGIGASVLNISIFDTGSAMSREIWTNVPGTSIASIPVDAPPHLSGAFGALEGITNYGDHYAERVRGYFTAPATANYYFWIAGSDSAQLWISDDEESVNKILRCWVTPTNNPTAPGQNGTSPRQWNLQSNQRSGWLALNAGQKYFLEILHKAGSGTNDHWAVGWRPDPTGTNTTPGGMVPAHLLSRHFTTPPSIVPGTLYNANLVAQGAAVSSGIGTATLRVRADGLEAVFIHSFSGLTSPKTGAHIHSDPYLAHPGQIIFDLDDTPIEADGSQVWHIGPVGTLTAADILEIIRQGKAFLNIHTANYPAGEIKGYFHLANGSQTFTPPPVPPTWADDSATTNGAARFLTQATFGPGLADIASVQSLGYSNWINQQISLPIIRHLSLVQTNKSADPSNPLPSALWFNTWWQNAVTAPDQLRQRVAFALSEILVVSESGSTLQDKADALAYYYDLLLTNAFGNFRELLEAVTLSPAMGVYLNMQGNAKGDLVAGTHPNENYAREINQLFSIGLNRLWPDGSLVLNSADNLVPTYGQNVINGFSAVFTGWNYFQTNAIATSFSPSANWTNQMSLVQSKHELGPKLLLNNVTLPPAWGLQTNTSSTNFACYNYCQQDLELAHDSIFHHPNVGPLICRQLIQRLVTSHPSRGYVYRVVQKFNDNGNGVRGDLAAVIKAILLDYEARSADLLAAPTYGKQREPLLRATAMARAFPSPPSQSGTYVESGTQTISLTMPSAHRLNNSDTVALSFVDPLNANPAPPSQSYPVTATGSNTFTITCPNLLSGTYVQSNYLITVRISGHGLTTGDAAYVAFTSGGASSKADLVTVLTSSNFTMTALDSFPRSGNCLLPRISASGYTQSTTNVTVFCSGPHALETNETVFIPPNSRNLPSGQYQVVGIPDPLRFQIRTTNSATRTESSFNMYPMNPPHLYRSGNATVRWSTWNLGSTDSGSTYNLSQSPLSANTVFNFFFPDYAFPGALSAAGLTTPEFQLTSDTSVALQMNFLASGILKNTGNTNGLSSFTDGDGDIVLDLGPWMTTNLTANAGVPLLVDNLNSLLLAGQLSATAKAGIVNYVTNTVNFPFSTPPTQTQIRDRVRAVVHLITASPDYTIQK